jgi:hypothetical protein
MSLASIVPDDPGLCCILFIAGLAMITGLVFAVFFAIRRLNETWFDPYWQAERIAEQRRRIAWLQWDEEMRAHQKLQGEVGKPEHSPENSIQPRDSFVDH